VRQNPSEYGCTPDYFETVVKYATNSESRIMNVRDAVNYLEKMD
jgi:hypothetical protein